MVIQHTNYSLLDHNTFGIDVSAHYFYEYSSVADLKTLLPKVQQHSSTILSIGAGSNLLFLSDFDGAILHSAIGGIEIVQETPTAVFVRVGAGIVWDDFVAWAVEHELGGIENLSYIPGEVGASAVQNIGAYGVEAKDVIHQVTTLDLATLEPRVFSNEECKFAYRQSIFKGKDKGKYIVTSVDFCLQKNPVFQLSYGNISKELAAYKTLSLAIIRQVIVAIRKSKLPEPKEEGNAGSFFMNPVVSKAKFHLLHQEYPEMPYYEVDAERVKIPAGWLIDQCGWKGKTIGRVGVHSKQALVLVNKGGATGKEVVHLSKEICKSVAERFAITISPEVNFIGKPECE
ncbi:MAG: UDP-N-acetylmuramate dehydrogenase [Bacteroidaceae bacterium]